MSEQKLSREEQETIIRGNAAGSEWEMVTADPRIIRRMARQGYRTDQRENPWGYVSFTVPFDRVKILRAEKRKLSEKHREALIKSHSERKRPTNRMPGEDQNLPAMI
ncbi:MAG: hypothetical protein LAP85_14710 [Acidobacteriia bacterium]|nr:hypothetical protein [Terriglobia bacterium]